MKRSIKMAQGIHLDITGMKFGHLTALYDTGERKNKRQVWMCHCDICGEKSSFRKNSLTDYGRTDCGCAQRQNAEDWTGKRFGKLTVIEVCPGKENPVKWFCQCDCGKTTAVEYYKLRDGIKKSCGCSFLEYTRGQKYEREAEMVGRTFGPVTVLAITDLRENRRIIWKCQCTCGNELMLSTGGLQSKAKAKKCCCPGNRDYSRPIKDFSGNVYGKLTVISPTGEKDKFGYNIWNCLCACGKKVQVSKHSLQSKPNVGSKSCGCSRNKKRGPAQDSE